MPIGTKGAPGSPKAVETVEHHEDAWSKSAPPPRRSSGKRARFSRPVRAQDFAIMEVPHPYGLLPLGNRFLDENETGRSKNIVLPTDLLSDQAWYSVLEFCNGQDLGRLIQTCRFFYIAGSEPELWRDLVLKSHENETITCFSNSWKDTYVATQHPHCKVPAHVPMSVNGVYSDYFYRLHSCRMFAIPALWNDLSLNTIPRIPHTDMTIERFEAEFERCNTPVVIASAAKSWRAFHNWKNCPDYFLENIAGGSFRATSGMASLPAQFSLSAYVDYCRSTHLEEAPLYLFDRSALSPGSVLWNDYMKDLQSTCPYWDPERNNDTTHDLFKVLGEGRRPDHTWLIIGPQRSGSVFHIDPNATHAWNAAICGRKRWIFYPPGVTPPGVHPSDDGDQVALPLSLGEWLFQFWDEHVHRCQTAPLEERPLECTVLPGDVLFVPHGWWHLVINLDEINIAITHNYVSGSNLPSVLKFLDEKRDQVSGCRDRVESVKPEELYEEFVKEMKRSHPELIEQALKDPTWACRAWKETQTSVKEHGGQRTSVMAKANCNEMFSFSFM